MKVHERTNLSPSASRGNQGFHLSVCGFYGCHESVRIGGDIDPRIPHFGLLALHIFSVVVDKNVTFPMCGAANLATRTPIFEADEKTLEFPMIVPPNHSQVIESAR